MGFTRHFTQFRHLTDTEWAEFRKGAMGILEGYFVEPPNPALEKGITFEHYSPQRFQINGEGSRSYESFCIMPDALGYNFCKTQGNLYDDYIAALLLFLKHIAPDAFRISADGDEADPTTIEENWDAGWQLLVWHIDNIDHKVTYNPNTKGVEIG